MKLPQFYCIYASFSSEQVMSSYRGVFPTYSSSSASRPCRSSAGLFTTLRGDAIVAEFIQILDQYEDSHYAAREVVGTPA